MTQDILDKAISQNTQPNQPAPTAQPATTQPATQQPVGAAAPSGDILDQAISHNTGQSLDSNPAVSGQPTTPPARPVQNSAAKHGILARAWDWINQPIFDNILPRDIKTSDIVKAAAFEKLTGSAYIPGINDFDTLAEAHMGGAKGELKTDSAMKNAIRTFIAGSAKDTADLAAGFTSPLTLATLGLGSEEVQGAKAVGKIAKVAAPLVGTAFGLQGLYHGAHGGFDILEHGATPENTQEMLGGLGQAALAGAAGAKDLQARGARLQEKVRPVTMTVAGQDIPVRADTKAGRFAAKLVEPETLTKASENTAAAVQQGVGEVAKGATGSDADTSIKGEDRFGLRGHASDLIENKARPVFKALDELSDGKFSEAQKAEKTARRVGDFDKLNEAVEKQDALTEEFRDELNERGLNPDEAWDNYRKGVAVQKLASQFDTATAAKDTGIGYQVKGDKLANTIDRIRRTAPEKNLFAKAGFTDSHIDALAELADTLRNEQNIPQFKSYQRLAAKALAGAIGFGHSGVLGLAEALTGESAAESVVRKGATSLLGKAMMSEPATRELTDALKDGDTDKGAAAVQNMATADPTWWDGLKNTLQTAWEKYKASPFSSEKGAVGMDINQPVKRLGGSSDAVKPTETPEFKKWFGDSKVLDEQGDPKVVYHGTTHEFNEFTPERGNAENAFGKGYYFTDDPHDASVNYAGKGPDLTQRIELLAERIQNEEEVTPSQAEQLAEERLRGKGGHVMPTYIKMENPVEVSPKGGTRFEMNIDDDGNESGTVVDLYNAVQHVANTWEHGSVDGQKIWNEAMEQVEPTDFTAKEFVDAMEKSLSNHDVYDNESGAYAANEFIRKVFESAGFDGIKQDAYHAFGGGRKVGKQMEMAPGTHHYIIFDPKHVKSATGNSGKFSPKSADIRSKNEGQQSARTEIAA